MGYPLKLYTATRVKCAASTSATRPVSTTSLLDYQSVTILAKNSNSGTLYINGGSNATKNGFPLTKGQSIDIGPTAMGGGVWHGIDPSSVYVFSTAGTADFVIVHYLAR